MFNKKKVINPINIKGFRERNTKGSPYSLDGRMFMNSTRQYSYEGSKYRQLGLRICLKRK